MAMRSKVGLVKDGFMPGKSQKRLGKDKVRTQNSRRRPVTRPRRLIGVKVVNKCFVEPRKKQTIRRSLTIDFLIVLFMMNVLKSIVSIVNIKTWTV